MVGADFVWIGSTTAGEDMETKPFRQPFYYSGLISVVPKIDKSGKKFKYLARQLKNRGVYRATPLSAKVYDSTMSLALALDKIYWDGELNFTNPELMCNTSTDKAGLDEFNTFHDGGNKIVQAMKKIMFDGATGTNISFSAQGGPGNNRYNVINAQQEAVMEIGTFDEDKGIKIAEPLQLYQGSYKIPPSLSTKISQHLIMGVVEDKPYVIFNYKTLGFEKCEEGITCYEGLNIDVINELAKTFQFTYDIVEAPDGQFGSEVREGEWDGLIGMLIRKEISMGIVAFGVESKREKVIDFTIPFMEGGVVMAFQEGALSKDGRFDPMSMFKSDSFFFLRPFSIELWIAIIITGCLISVLIWIYDLMSPYGFYGGTRQKLLCCECDACKRSLKGDFEVKGCPFEDQQSIHYEMKSLSLFNSTWLVICSFLQVGPPDATPKCWSTRVLITAWWLIGLVLVSLYTANLAAFLTVSRIQKDLHTMEDLLNSNYAWGTVNGTITEHLLSSSADHRLQMISRKASNVNSFEEGIARIRSERYAFLSGLRPLEYAAGLKPCGMKVTHKLLVNYGHAFALPDESPILEKINKGLIDMQQRKEIDLMWRQWSSGECSHMVVSRLVTSVDIHSVIGTLAIIMPVIALSLLVFVLEYMKGKRSPDRHPKLTNMINEHSVAKLKSLLTKPKNTISIENGDVQTVMGKNLSAGHDGQSFLLENEKNYNMEQITEQDMEQDTELALSDQNVDLEQNTEQNMEQNAEQNTETISLGKGDSIIKE